jgi:hypothetical protein
LQLCPLPPGSDDKRLFFRRLERGLLAFAAVRVCTSAFRLLRPKAAVWLAELPFAILAVYCFALLYASCSDRALSFRPFPKFIAVGSLILGSCMQEHLLQILAPSEPHLPGWLECYEAPFVAFYFRAAFPLADFGLNRHSDGLELMDMDEWNEEEEFQL